MKGRTALGWLAAVLIPGGLILAIGCWVWRWWLARPVNVGAVSSHWLNERIRERRE